MKDWIKRHYCIFIAMILFVVTYAILCSISASYINFDNNSSRNQRRDYMTSYERTQNEYNVKVARFYFIQLPLGASVPALLYLLSAFIVKVRRGEVTVKDRNQITSATNNNGEFSTKDVNIEMMITDYTQEKQKFINEWYAAHPRPQYQIGETLDHFRARLVPWEEELKEWQKNIKNIDELITKIQAKRKEWSRVNNAYMVRQSGGALGPQLDAAYQTKLKNIESDIENLEAQMRIALHSSNQLL